MIYNPLPDDIRDVISSVIKSAVKAVGVSKVYLFGSYYNGTYTEDSDIDLAFFIHNDECLIDAHRKIIRITSKYPIDIQPQIFYENELDEKIGIVGEVIENGGEIYTGNTE
jgi:predicted nucleotidyltransferase